VSGPGTPTGVVIFADGAMSVGQGSLNTVGGTTTASFNTSSLTAGSHTINASYTGDGNFLASAGTVTQTVGKSNTTTAVVSSANPSTVGQSLMFTAMVTVSSPGTPTGLVVFSDGATSIGQATLATAGTVTSASCST